MKKLIFLVLLLSFLQTILYAQWVQISSPSPYSIGCFTSYGSNIFAGGEGVFISTNNGNNWTSINNGLPIPRSIERLKFCGSNLFASVSSSTNYGTYGIYRSTNNGQNWIACFLTYNDCPHDFAINGNNIFADMGHYIYLSSNNGVNWISVSNGLPTNLYIHRLISSGSNLFAGISGGGVYLTSNNGGFWYAVNTGLSNLNIGSLVVFGSNLFAGTNQGIFYSSNNGGYWTPVNNGLTSESIMDIVINGSYIFAGLEYTYPNLNNGGIFLTTNNGTNWINKNQGLPSNARIWPIIVANNFVFICNQQSNSTLYRRSYSEIIGINKISETVPTSFSLFQNYPNPFNPSTNIKYQISKNSSVKLIVFDVLGREVETLLNEKQSPGTYEVLFDARLHGQGSKLSSGIYFYKLETGNFSDVKSMVLIK